MERKSASGPTQVFDCRLVLPIFLSFRLSVMVNTCFVFLKLYNYRALFRLDTLRSILPLSSLWFLMTTLPGIFCSSHFIDVETEAP